MRALICGGRGYGDVWKVQRVLSALKVESICTGGASGADRHAQEWAEANGIKCAVFPAEWQEHGRSAGPIRNQRMLEQFTPSIVVAFPGGRGTEDMISRAKARNVPVLRVEP